MRQVNLNQNPYSRQAGSLWRSCRTELIALALALGISGIAARVMPSTLGELDAVAASLIIFLVWGAICIVMYRLYQHAKR